MELKSIHVGKPPRDGNVVGLSDVPFDLARIAKVLPGSAPGC